MAINKKIARLKLIDTTINQGRQVVRKSAPFNKILTFSVTLNLATLAIVFATFNKLPPKIPLYFGLAEGEAQLANASSIVLPNLISLLIIVLNTTLASKTSDDYLKRTLIIGAVSTSVVASIAVFEIILLVGSFR